MPRLPERCLVTKYMAALCSVCGASSVNGPVHFHEPDKVYCANCCPVHRPAQLDWKEPVKETTKGEQLTLL